MAPKGKRSVGSDGSVKVAAKASNGSGSVYYDKGRKCWVAVYKGRDGRRKVAMGQTQREATDKRDQRRADIEASRPSSALGGNPTFGRVADWWLEHIAPTKARPGTVDAYRGDVKRLKSVIGDLPLRDLDYPTSETTIATLRATHGHGTVRNARARLRQIAELGVELGFLVRNPVVKVTTPAKTESERAPKRVLDTNEVAALLGVLSGAGPLDAAISLLFVNGLRASECLGLAWDDIDLEAGEARIVRGCTYSTESGMRLDKTKTARTVGRIPLAPLTVELLKARKIQQAKDRLAAGVAWMPTTYEGEELSPVFTTPRGLLMREQRLGEALYAAMEQAELEPCKSTHMGRRSVITNLDGARVQLHLISDFVGHSSVDTTRGYLQNRAERSKEAGSKVMELYGLKSEQPATTAK